MIVMKRGIDRVSENDKNFNNTASIMEQQNGKNKITEK